MPVAPSPEYDLLLDAIAAAPTARVDPRRWDHAQWQRTLRAAEWHRLTPALACHCADIGGVPDDVRATLEQRYLENAARNLFVAATLQRVLDALGAAGTPVMTLKGAALVETVYADPALREMLDIDLLVPTASLDDANATLTAIGFGPVDSPDDADRGGDPRVNHHHDPALVTDERIVAVELHHHIAMVGERAQFDVADLWERARPGITGGDHLLPSAEDLLLHVCFHFTRNRVGGSAERHGTGGALAQLADIAALVAGEPIDWGALNAQARAYRLATRVFLALFAAREIGIPIPATALDALRPSGFDPRLGRRLVELRVLRDGQTLPVRSLRFIIAPGREVLERGWDADARGAGSLARAYVRRAASRAPAAGAALKRPWASVQDYRLNGRIGALEHAE